MTAITIPGVDSIDDLFEQLSTGILEMVKLTGGDVRIDMEDDANPSLIFKISVDGVEWTRVQWNENETVGVFNSPTFLARIAELRGEG